MVWRKAADYNRTLRSCRRMDRRRIQRETVALRDLSKMQIPVGALETRSAKRTEGRRRPENNNFYGR